MIVSTGIERVGDHLGDDGFFERAGVGVAKVFEEMLEVDARLAHTRHPIRFTGSNPFHAHTRCRLCKCGEIVRVAGENRTVWLGESHNERVDGRAAPGLPP